MNDGEMPVDPQAGESEDPRAEWETPELIVESVEEVTGGGTIGTVNSPGDDIWYVS